jgi:four helix bundle protein
MKDFKELRVWAKAHRLALDVYQLTQSFPREELFGLTSQIRRSVGSIGANIAEGCGRRSDGELTRFLQIARGSASELECQLLLARDLHFLSIPEFQRIERHLVEVQRMLTSLVRRVQPLPRSRPQPQGPMASVR